MEVKKTEYVYICSNPSIPGMVKIGFTTNSPKERMKQLFNTSVPTPFVLERVYKVRNTRASKMESGIHHHLSRYRVDSRREYFRLSADEAHEKISKMLDSKGRNYRLRRNIWRAVVLCGVCGGAYYMINSDVGIKGIMEYAVESIKMLLQRIATG